MKCEHCGAEIGPDDLFCPGCGDPVIVSAKGGGKKSGRAGGIGRGKSRAGKNGVDEEENNLPLIILAGVLSVLIVVVGVIGVML